jgi:hypothetical protein
MAWKAGNKTDLIIEVWEKLDCESVGAAEIEAIEVVVADIYGADAVDSPMVIARILADEGAYLRHAEIMGLYVRRAEHRGGQPSFQDALNFEDLGSALASIEKLEVLRTRLLRDKDRHGLRSLREAAIRCKDQADAKSGSSPLDAMAGLIQSEIAEWLRVWLQTPEVFTRWVELRQRSRDFKEKFGNI